MPSERDGLPLRHGGHRAGLGDGRGRTGGADRDGGRRGSGRRRGLGGCGATFTAHDSRRGTRGQLYEVTVEVQLAGLARHFFRSAAIWENWSRAASRFSAISAAITSGSGRLAESSRLSSFSQKMSRLILSRLSKSW